MNYHSSDDTICAISTAPGVGGIAVIRVSGPDAFAITDRIWRGKRIGTMESHTAHLGAIIDSEGGGTVDQAVATVFRGPNSFTGQDTVELSVHGSRWIQQEVLRLLIAAGCRMADAGEFTRRAFITGRLTLNEAEAVADLIAANSRAAHRVAINQMRGQLTQRLDALRTQLIELSALLELELDFSEEDVEFASREQLRATAQQVAAEIARLQRTFAAGSAIKEGVATAIIGATNVGKSSLLNRLVDDNRAIVSDIHGTTRDVIEDTATLGDFTFRFIDTAGLRDTTDTIERLGIERSREAISKARIVIIVIDPTQPDSISAIDAALSCRNEDTKFIIAVNKSDIAESTDIREKITVAGDIPVVAISAHTGAGIDQLITHLTRMAGADDVDSDQVIITNLRHSEALSHAAAAITRVIHGLGCASTSATDHLANGLPGDLIAEDLREALYHIGTITGAITTTDILTTVFNRFCIGK